jgi:acetyl coenzyme A synthetase (ADP forming)-like protein
MTMPNPLDAIFRPRSVAVIGASRKPGVIGREIFERLRAFGFTGALYPVNPAAETIGGLKAYRSVTDCPSPVDLALVVVPYSQVEAVVQDCARAGVKGLVVITSGFKEVGPEGAERERRLLELVRRSGMRMIGPNCMGILNSASDVRLNATFSPVTPPRGPIGIISQSGALGLTILDVARSLDLGTAMFVSTGNKADVSSNDLLAYWEDDPAIRLILMYIESFGNPVRFRDMAARIGRRKPIIVVKSGRTAAGARAASSHTGALAGEDALFDALFHQCGVIRAETVEEWFDFALAFAHQPLPCGPRVAILTNAGGPGIMLADACELLGLQVVPLSADTQAFLKRLLPGEASTANPVDMIASATEDTFKSALGRIAADDNVDAVIVVFVPPIMTDAVKVAIRVGEVTDRLPPPAKPVLGCFMGARGLVRVPAQSPDARRPETTPHTAPFQPEPARAEPTPVERAVEELQRHHIPAYAFPESAARALASMWRYRTWRDKPPGKTIAFPSLRTPLERIIAEARIAGREWLPEPDVMKVLTGGGIPVVRSVSVRARADLPVAARQVGYPVVVKVDSPAIIHKARVGGVLVDIRSEDELKRNLDTLEARLTDQGIRPGNYGFVLQPMVSGGREVIMGISRTSRIGPVLMFGLGGIFVETLKDVIFRLAPITDLEAREMIAGIRAFPILQGRSGNQPVALELLAEMLLRLSQLATEVPDIIELDINPFLAFPDPTRSVAVDARIRISLPQP